MNSRELAALLSSLISQLLTLLLLLFPASNPLTDSIPMSTSQEFTLPLLHHFHSIAEIAAALSFSRKRKRVHLSEPNAPDDDDDPGPRLGKLNRLGCVDPTISRNPDSFSQFFKMETSTFEWLCGLLEPLLDCRDPIDAPLNLAAETRLGIGVFRLATGADYPEISSRFGVSEMASRFCVTQLCRILCTDFRFWVGFPSQTELEPVSTQFETLIHLPNCCGVIRCARFLILRKNESFPITQNTLQEESIAAQMVVDSSSRILSVIAGFRGNKSDSQILQSSTLFEDIENGKLLTSVRPSYINEVEVPRYLIADGSYPLLPWLLVPFVDPKEGSIEANFNNLHNLVRVSGLKAVASLRNWGVLSRPIETEYKVAVSYIGACSILHNMLIVREDYSAFCDDLGDWELINEERSGDYELNASLDETAKEKALAIRNALATKARDIRISHYGS